MNFERYDFSVNDHHGGPREIGNIKKQAPWDLDLTGYNRFCATIFRAAFHYYHKDIQGLRRPPQNSFWATQVKIAAFDWYEISDNGDMWAGRNLLLGSLIHIYKPQRPSNEVYATTIHELAHAVHWDMSTQIAGPFYTNYGRTTTRICEAWTRGVQWVLTKMEYPSYFGGDNYGDYTNIVVDMIDSESDAIYNNGKSGSLDQVEGYNIVQIQNALKDSYTSEQWKTKLFNSTTNGTAQHVEALFTNWGF